MAYTINIKAADFKDSFFGTGFFGETFSSIDDLKKIFREHGPKKNVVTELTFSTAETTSRIKSLGNRLAAEGKNINIFALAAIQRKDKFNGITIYYLPNGWIDDKGTFKFVLDINNNLVPQYNKKLKAILLDLGMRL